MFTLVLAAVTLTVALPARQPSHTTNRDDTPQLKAERRLHRFVSQAGPLLLLLSLLEALEIG